MRGSANSKITSIGFGEAARAFTGGWSEADRKRTLAYDIKLDDPMRRPEIEAACAERGIAIADTLAQALEGSHCVFSLVTADKAHDAAIQASAAIEPGTLFLDCNSCSPATKKASRLKLEAADAIYVDVAIMAPVAPSKHRTALLVSGREADAAIAILESLGMRPSKAGSEIGHASAIKMLRSVMIKGLEALTAECMLAARRAGVEDAVLASLQASDPGVDWPVRSAYNLERMMVHGERRAAEMLEVAATVRELGLSDRMAMATAGWQQQIADLGLEAGESVLADRADRILDRLR